MSANGSDLVVVQFSGAGFSKVNVYESLFAGVSGKYLLMVDLGDDEIRRFQKRDTSVLRGVQGLIC
jgi:hypothetical protein